MGVTRLKLGIIQRASNFKFYLPQIGMYVKDIKGPVIYFKLENIQYNPSTRELVLVMKIIDE